MVTVPALPLTEPVIRLEKTFEPPKVLLSASKVVEATTMLAEPLKETPLMVRGVWSVVALEAFPVRAPVRPPEKVMLVVVAFPGKRYPKRFADVR